jgi:hypothetical protein
MYNIFATLIEYVIARKSKTYNATKRCEKRNLWYRTKTIWTIRGSRCILNRVVLNTTLNAPINHLFGATEKEYESCIYNSVVIPINIWIKLPYSGLYWGVMSTFIKLYRMIICSGYSSALCQNLCKLRTSVYVTITLPT